MGFGCNGVHQFHMMSVPSRIDLLLMGSNESPNCHKKKYNSYFFFCLT